ncbi:MAG: Uma2 family endonuclease [Kofleriaceae bacterium]
MDEASAPPSRSVAITDDSRILLRGVAWSTYVVLRDEPADMHLRMTYLQGELEIMSPGMRHEVFAVQIARLLELFCHVRGIDLYGFGGATYREKPRARGLEPDRCYARDRVKKYPDVALEVIVTSPLLDKLEVYRGLGILEVWVFEAGRFTIHRLRADRYVTIGASEVFPEVDLARIAHYAAQPNQPQALRDFEAELRR